MEMQQIRYFMALAREHNFTRAAESCNVSQPALTRAIQALEGELGGPLFVRERTQTRLSDLGEIMRPHIEQLFTQAEEAKARAKGFKKLANVRLKLGVMCTIAPHILAPLLVKFQEQFPGVELSIKDFESKILIDGLHKGALECALSTVPDPPDERLHGLPLYTESFVVVLPPNHHLAREPVVRARDLNGIPYVSRMNCEVYTRVSDALVAIGVNCPMVFRSERDDWVLGMIRAGLGWGFFPAFCEIPEDLPSRPLVEPSFERTIHMVTVRGRPHSPAVGAFLRAARAFDWPGKHAD